MYSESALNRALNDLWVGTNLFNFLPFAKLDFGVLLHHSVAFDAKMTGGNGASGNSQQAANVTSISSTGMTVGASATCLIGMLVMELGNATPTSVTMTWNSVSMTPRANTTFSDGVRRNTVYIFSLANTLTTGNQTLAAAWTNSMDAYMSCISFTGTDTATGVDAAHNITSTEPATTVVVTSTTDGATVATSAENSGDPTMDQTAIWVDSPFAPGGGGSYAIGGTSNTHTFTFGSGTTQATAGVHVIASTAAAVLEQTHYRFRADDGTLAKVY